jgi:hypothetical protein
LGRGLISRKAGDSIDRFRRLAILLDMKYLTVDTKDLAHIWKLQVAV